MAFSFMRLAVRQHKWATIRTLPDQQLTTFSFAKNENKRLQIIDSREIRVDGKLYDVARIIDDGVTITYYCLQDELEDSLIAKTRQLNAMVHSSPAKKTSGIILDSIIKTGVFTTNNCFFKQTYCEILQSNYLIFDPDPYISEFTPPPKSCII